MAPHQRLYLFIDINDFIDAAHLLKSAMLDFHRDRIFSLQLQEEQKRPEVFNQQSMFVISKKDVVAMHKAPLIDQHEKQVYFEFDRSPLNPSQVEIYKMHLDADPDFLICATDSEMRHYDENKAHVKK